MEERVALNESLKMAATNLKVAIDSAKRVGTPSLVADLKHCLQIVSDKIENSNG